MFQRSIAARMKTRCKYKLSKHGLPVRTWYSTCRRSVLLQKTSELQAEVL